MNARKAPSPFPIFERTGTPDEMSWMDREIETVADDLIADLDRASSSAPRAGRRKKRLQPEDVRFLAYALCVHRSRRGGVLTEHHLRLLAAALRIRRPSLRAAEKIGLAPVKDHKRFLAAADRQGIDPTISESALAKEIGVERATIRAWRKLRSFGQRVRMIRQLNGNPTEEDKRIAASWAAACESVNAVYVRRTRGGEG